MKKMLLALLITGVASTAYAGVKEVYKGYTGSSGNAYYVIKCTDGSKHTDIHQRSDGYWYDGSTSLSSSYKGLSINEVASRMCS